MKARIIPALSILAVGLISAVIVLVSDALTGDWMLHLASAVLAAGLLAMIATIQKWEHFAWLPVLGFVVASGGFIAGEQTVLITGLLMFAVLTVWHGHQREGRGYFRRREESLA